MPTSVEASIRDHAAEQSWKTLQELAAQGVLVGLTEELHAVVIQGLRRLASRPLKDWHRLTESVPTAGLAALAGVAEPERAREIRALLLTTFQTFVQILKEAEEVSDRHAAQLVAEYGKQFNARTEDIDALANVVPKLLPQALEQRSASGRPRELFKVFSNEFHGTFITRTEVDAWLEQYGPFVILFDEPERKLLIEGEAVRLPKKERELLSIVLEHMPIQETERELPNQMVAVKLWNYPDEPRRHIDQVYARLKNKTKGMLNDCIKADRSWDSRVISPNVRYCLVRQH